ncbi:hypothetical protein FQR65_LT03694 [Abscondita terminalis]|nr:hypothetical protein FQR65_LT03694 [Abscondita terminalis]
MGKVNIRDVSPALQKFRNFLAGRKLIPALRFPHEVASRSPELPNLPTGPHDCLSNNYYCGRDARREVQPPPVITAQAQLPAGTEKAEIKTKLPTPGDHKIKCHSQSSSTTDEDDVKMLKDF